jgi:hypothetical protein
VTIPNALAAEVYLRFMALPSRITLPANMAVRSWDLATYLTSASTASNKEESIGPF